MGNAQNAATRFRHQQPWCTEAIAITSTVEIYKQTLQYFKEDGQYNLGRALSLEVYTRDVIKKYPQLTTAVQEEFQKAMVSILFFLIVY